MNQTALKALSWIVAVLVILAVILLVGFGSGAWPFTQMPPGRLVP